MSLLRTVGARLSLALLAVVAIALALVYVVVVPSLQSRLVGSRLDDLSRAARQLKYDRNDPDFFTNAAASANARVLLMEILTQTPPAAVPTEYSLPGQSASAYTDDPVALAASHNARLERGTVTRNDEKFAEVGIPVSGGSVLLLSSPLHDALADVSAVRRRLLLSGALALLVALAIGYAAARFFARRIRRLERAAD